MFVDIHMSHAIAAMVVTALLWSMAEICYHIIASSWGMMMADSLSTWPCAKCPRVLSPARWAGRRRAPQIRRHRLFLDVDIIGDAAEEEVERKRNSGCQTERRENPIWLLPSQLLGAGSDSQPSSSPAQRLYPGPSMEGFIDVELYHGAECTLALAVVEGTLWKQVRDRLAQHLGVHHERIVMHNRWGGLVMMTQAGTAPPSGAPRKCQYRVTHGLDPVLHADRSDRERSLLQAQERRRSRSPRTTGAQSSSSHMVVLRDDQRDREVQTEQCPQVLTAHWHTNGTTQHIGLHEGMFNKHKSAVTPYAIEMKIKELYPAMTPASTRLGLMIGETHTYGRALAHNQPIPLDLWHMQENLYAVPSTPVGSNGNADADHARAVGLCQNALKGRLQRNQIKLLLCGDSGLEKRVLKLDGMPGSISDMILAAARRYRMEIKDVQNLKDGKEVKEHLAEHRKEKASAPPSGSDRWNRVERQRRGKTAGSTSPSPPSFTLIADDWTHPPMEQLRLGCAGIFMPASQEKQRRMRSSSRVHLIRLRCYLLTQCQVQLIVSK